MAAFLQLTLHFGQTLQGGQVRAAGIQGSLSSPRGRAFSRVPPSGPSTADWEVTCPVLVHHEWLPRQGSLPDTSMSVTQFGGQDHPGEGFRLLEGFALSFTPERALLLVPAVRRLFGPLPRRRSRD